MHEIDVALTDYALTVFCVWLGAKSYQEVSFIQLKNWVLIFYIATAMAAFFGGTVHGFLPDESSHTHLLLWRATLAFIGLAAVACFRLGLIIIGGPISGWLETMLLSIAYFGYLAFIFYVSHRFIVATVAYTPAMTFLAASALWRFGRTKNKDFQTISIAVVISFIAAATQTFEIGLHPLYFNHNAVYHVIQALGLYLLYRGIRGIRIT